MVECWYLQQLEEMSPYQCGNYWLKWSGITGIGLEEMLGISFRCSLFADKKPSLPLPCLKPTKKVFWFRYWTSSSFKGTQGSWVSCYLINTGQLVRASPASFDRESWERIGRKTCSGEQEKSFYPPASNIRMLSNCITITPHCCPHTRVSPLPHTCVPPPLPSVLPIHYTLSAQKHLGTCLHPYRLHKPHALPSTSFFTPALPRNVIKHQTSPITFALHYQPKPKCFCDVFHQARFPFIE